MSRLFTSRALVQGRYMLRDIRAKDAASIRISRLTHNHRQSTAVTEPLLYMSQTNNMNIGLPLRNDFSTAAMMPQVDQTTSSSSSSNIDGNSTKQRPKRTRRSLDPLTITPAAAARINFLISQHNLNNPGTEGPAVGIRLGTKKRGCNGLSYTLNYAYENHIKNHPRDEAMTIKLPSPEMEGNGLKVFVEPMALMNVIGTNMDFVDDEMSSEFTFTNPNSKGECGCGESFNV
jgi:iron-sulfur cluster assembly accessory protein